MAVSFVNGTVANNGATSTTSLSCNVPTGLSVGDVVIFYVTAGAGTNNTMSVPTGLTAISAQVNSGTTVSARGFWRTIDGTEPGSYSFSVGATARPISAAGAGYTGVDPVSPIAGSNTIVNAASTTATFPAVTPLTESNYFVKMIGGRNATSSSTVSANGTGYSLREDATNTVANFVETAILDGATSTGINAVTPNTSTITVSSAQCNTALSLRPAPGTSLSVDYGVWAKNTAGTTGTVTYTTSHANESLVLFVQTKPSAVSSISDSSGNTWTKITNIADSLINQEVWTSFAATATTGTLTVTFAASTQNNLEVYTFNNGNSTPTGASSTNTGTGTPSTETATLTTTGPNSWVWGGHSTSGVGTYSANTGTTLSEANTLATGTSNQAVIHQTSLTTSSGTSVTNSVGSTGSSDWAAIAVEVMSAATVVTKTQPAVARIANNVTKTQTAIARIAKIITKTQPATARIATNRTLTQGATARIAVGVTKTQTATSRIANNRTLTQGARARVGNAFLASLASYWKLDDASGSTATDSIGGNNGTWQGTLGNQWGTGKINGDGVFNGSDNYIAVGNAANLSMGTGNFTLSAWVKTTATSRQTILHKYLYTGTSVESGYYIDMLAGGNIRTVYETTNANLRNSDSAVTINDGNWHLITVVRPSTTGDPLLYIDGTLDASATHAFDGGTPGNIDNTVPFAIGQSIAGSIGVNNWTGQIDEVGIWARDLSSTEVANLYASGSGMSFPFTTVLSTKTQSATARIANIRTATQPAVARIAKNITKTQTSIARIALNRTFTQSAVARIARNLTKTQPAVARIATIPTKTQPAVARIATIPAKTQPAVARIAKNITKTQPAVARVAINPTKTQTAVSRIATIPTKTQPAIARIAKSLTKTQSATANITTGTVVTKTQSAIARIANTPTKTQPAIARIAKTLTKTQPAVARIANTRTLTQGAVARISNTPIKTQTATARIATAVNKTQPATARIATNSTKTQPAIARISVTPTKTQPAVARIAVRRTATQSATASIIGGSAPIIVSPKVIFLTTGQIALNVGGKLYQPL